MRCIIYNHDMIKKLSRIEGIEVGNLPKGVGLERLRWNGSKIVDLDTMSFIWCEYIGNNAFRLHVIEVPHSQQVKMQYKDRKKLWNDGGIYKIKSNKQIQTELNLQYRRAHYPLISDQVGALIKYIKTLPNLPDELQDIIDKIDNVKIEYPKTLEIN